MTTALFHLRAVQLGLTISELDRLNYGDVMDMVTEHNNDSCEYREIAGQDDFDRF